MNLAEQQLGPWALNHPAMWILERALIDRAWQQEARSTLHKDSVRLVQTLMQADFDGMTSMSNSGLFVTLSFEHHLYAKAVYNSLCQQGILVRLFQRYALVRFGLPGNKQDWQRLSA